MLSLAKNANVAACVAAPFKFFKIGQFCACCHDITFTRCAIIALPTSSLFSLPRGWTTALLKGLECFLIAALIRQYNLRHGALHIVGHCSALAAV
jgi:hypothetical protein